MRCLLLLVAFAACEAIKVGDKISSAMVHSGFGNPYFDITQRLAGKKVILQGLPGAFTPT